MTDPVSTTGAYPEPTPPPAAGLRRLLRSSAAVSAGVALSRVTGFARLAVLAALVGFGPLADAYNLANNTPTILYELLLGGVLSATLVPVFVERLDAGDEAGPSAVTTLAVVLTVVVAGIGFVAAPLVIDLYSVAAPDSATAADQERLATDLLRWFVFQLPFYGLFALWSGVLQARRRFAAQAFAPVLNNVVVIAALVLLAVAVGTEPVVSDVLGDLGTTAILGLGTTLGIVAMALMLWPAVRRSGVRLRWRFEPRNPTVIRVLRLSGWTVGYVVANQVSLLVVTALALGTEGGVTTYQAAFLLLQLPYALLALPLTTTFTPELAAAVNRGDDREFVRRLRQGRALTALVTLPAGAGLAVLAWPIVGSLLDYGALTAESAALTADTLALFALSLPPMAAYLFVLRGFYARQDTRTPFLVNVLENAVNVALALALYPLLGVPGLALSWTLAYLVGVVVALLVLRRRVPGAGSGFPPELGRMLVAALLMAGVVWAVTRPVGADDGVGAIVRSAVGLAAGLVTYVAAVVVLRVPAVADLVERVRRRGRGGADGPARGGDGRRGA